MPESRRSSAAIYEIVKDEAETERLFAHHLPSAGVLMETVLDLGGVSVDVIRKDIKNLHLSVHPPTGRVRIAAPERASLETIRAFAVAHLAWIRRHQRKITMQEREPPREYVDRESHFVWGERVMLADDRARRRSGRHAEASHVDTSGAARRDRR